MIMATWCVLKTRLLMTTNMKRILLLLVAAALVVPCSAQNKAMEKALGDKFAFAGLETAKLVPAFATEISELKTDPRSESNPMKVVISAIACFVSGEISRFWSRSIIVP